MTDSPELTIRIRSRASEARCATCPPDRVCAWACEQGASVPDIVYGAALLLDNRLTVPPVAATPVDQALWDCYNYDYNYDSCAGSEGASA